MKFNERKLIPPLTLPPPLTFPKAFNTPRVYPSNINPFFTPPNSRLFPGLGISPNANIRIITNPNEAKVNVRGNNEFEGKLFDRLEKLERVTEQRGFRKPRMHFNYKMNNSHSKIILDENEDSAELRFKQFQDLDVKKYSSPLNLKEFQRIVPDNISLTNSEGKANGKLKWDSAHKYPSNSPKLFDDIEVRKEKIRKENQPKFLQVISELKKTQEPNKHEKNNSNEFEEMEEYDIPEHKHESAHIQKQSKHSNIDEFKKSLQAPSFTVTTSQHLNSHEPNSQSKLFHSHQNNLQSTHYSHQKRNQRFRNIVNRVIRGIRERKRKALLAKKRNKKLLLMIGGALLVILIAFIIYTLAGKK